MNKSILLLLAFITSNLLAQEIITPLRKNNYSKPASYDEIAVYVRQLDSISELITTEVIAKSAEGRNIFGIKFSSSQFGSNPSKVKVLLLAQQHGNEQAGKEGALLLMQELLKAENRYLFERIDLAIVPQMNPDGSDSNSRRNGNGMDLNRNHLIITEPEVIGLHRLFDQYLFEVTLDAHEYFPYGETWQKYGYRNNSDLLLGTATNSNVSEKLRGLSNKSYLPFIKEFLGARNVSNFIYSPGGPPELDYIRHSTFDINDGRQSFAIQNTLSFIQEGLNGTDRFADNIKHRAESQMSGMRGLLEYTYRNSKKIKSLVARERAKLVQDHSSIVAIQSEHVRNGEKLHLPLLSYSTGRDTLVIVSDYRPVVKSIYDVNKPAGYLIPKQLKELAEWVDRQGIISHPYKPELSDKIELYEAITIDSIDFEGDIVVNPTLAVKKLSKAINPDDYIYLPTNQLKGDMIVIALEPKSMLGLVTYKEFSHLLKKGEPFPVLRVIKK
ncbi:MAG: hypothetical protein IPN67_16015 [Bacteroidales bacterium]|nr:hypothetical protein [Bacteroidales bacterium]